MSRRKWFICGVVLLLAAAVLTGCPAGDDNGDTEPPPDNGDGQQAEIDINTLVGQWVESSHSNILLYPAQRDNCVVCHDGGAFSEQITEQANIERDFYVAIDCRACHQGRGVELMEAGTVSIPTAENVTAGTGAQCLACHNERKVPNIDDERRSAPHASSQAGVYTATGGIRAEGFEYGSTTAHTNIDNTCIGCHMTVGEEGFQSHTFRVDDVQAACGDCHQDIQNANLGAKEDYDGDGETGGFQDEVDGLLTILEGAITEALDGGTFETGGGAINFKDAAGAEVTDVPNEIYQAAYNHVLVSQDGSLGIHNPTFAVQLLQQSYKALTGEDVPNATIK
ncbi:MAG: ammonia-forming cytochrome c nitrite reductase subunit c552 [Bacillota bacterium]|nr:ammonia-forming cytochrome c nitrite reductase subunit c552 [Bacillota bacterium]MDW7684659.1 ammonia-forming cytochrome c nitrite reductase subunit c552 [Bacillota bacterium]